MVVYSDVNNKDAISLMSTCLGRQFYGLVVGLFCHSFMIRFDNLFDSICKYCTGLNIGLITNGSKIRLREIEPAFGVKELTWGVKFLCIRNIWADVICGGGLVGRIAILI